MKKIRLFTLLGILALISAFCLIKFTHGIVVIKSHEYQNREHTVEVKPWLKITFEAEPTPLNAHLYGGYDNPKVIECPPFDLISYVTPDGSHVGVSISSDYLLKSGKIESVLVTDDTGSEEQSHLKDYRLPPYANSPDVFKKTEIDGWNRPYAEGLFKIEVTGSVVLNDSEEAIPFVAEADFTGLYLYSVLTRRKWDEFYGHNLSIWRN